MFRTSLLVVLLWTACGLTSGKVIRHRNYDGDHRATWIDVPFDEAGVRVDRITWCSELYPHQMTDRDIGDCSASNLLHVQIYPGKDAYVEWMRGGMGVRVNTNVVAGFWLNRQSDVIVSGRRADGAELEAVVRFHVPGTTLRDTTTTTTRDMPTFAEATEAPLPALAEQHPVDAWVNVDVQPSTSQDPPTARPTVARYLHWIIAGFGTLLTIVAILLVVSHRKRRHEKKKSDGDVSAYVFERGDPVIDDYDHRAGIDVLLKNAKSGQQVYLANAANLKADDLTITDGSVL